MNNIFKIVLVSGINVVKLVSIVENVISINVRTVFLLVVYFKSMKNVLISSKYGFLFLLNLFCDGKEIVNFEITSTTLFNGFQYDFVMLFDIFVIMNMNCEVMYWLFVIYVIYCSFLFDVLFICKNDLECVEIRIWGKF